MAAILLLALLTPGQECRDLEAGGREAYERRAFAEAAALFEAAVARCGAGEPLLLGLAQAQLLDRQVEASLATLGRLLAAHPRHAGALKVQARAFYLAGRDADAERALTAAAALAPADDEIPYDLGRIYYQQKRHAAAAAQFERAVALNPAAYRAWDNLGLATEALGDVPAALRSYLKAVDLVHTAHPHYDVVYANLADLMLKLEDHQKAFDLAAEAAERNPDDPRNLFLAGKALVRMERFDLSLKWLERAVALDPSYPEPRYVLAQAYRRLGRPADAERELNAFRDARARVPGDRR